MDEKTEVPKNRRFRFKWKKRMAELGIKTIPKWKKKLLSIAWDLRYDMSQKDMDFILMEANEIQAENILKRYRLQ